VLLALTWISFNMTAAVCQLDKLVPAISPTGQWIAVPRACLDMREGYLCQIESGACLLAPDWQPVFGESFCGSKILAAAPLAPRV
jgi:hypothetical protein